MFFTLPLHISIFQLYLALFYRARPIIACESCKWHFLFFTSAFHTVVYMFGHGRGINHSCPVMIIQEGYDRGSNISRYFYLEDSLQKCQLTKIMSISINCPTHLNMNAVPVCYPFHYKLLRWWIFPYCFPFKFLVYVVQRTWISTQSTFLVNLCVGEFYLILFSYFYVRSAICFH